VTLLGARVGTWFARVLLPLFLLTAPAAAAVPDGSPAVDVLCAGCVPAGGIPTSDTSVDTVAAAVRIFFLSDAHSHHRHVVRFVDEANRVRPDLVLEAGDMVHDGTEAEFRRALAERARLEAPWLAAPGNHDLELRGEFDGPEPEFPRLRTVDRGDLRVVLIDNHSEQITETQFQRLEEALRTASDRRTLVAMHVPPRLSREPWTLRIRHVLPYRLASPVMTEPEQVQRFTSLMERHGVLAVLAGHTHFPDHFVDGGVHYIVTGALGGLTPGLDIANQFTEILLDGREVTVRRVAMSTSAGDPVRFLARAFRFYAELNQFNHSEEGWTFVPSASVQIRSGVRRIEAGGEPTSAPWAAVSFERLLGERGRQSFLADLGLTAGPRALSTDLAVGYRVRSVGDFNRNLYVGPGVTANAGALAGSASAGVGVQAAVGAEWRHLTLELSHGRATNHRATQWTLGWRY